MTTLTNTTPMQRYGKARPIVQAPVNGLLDDDTIKRGAARERTARRALLLAGWRRGVFLTCAQNLKV